MKVTLFATIASLAALAAAQLQDVPVCAQGCLTSGLPSQCALTNIACICGASSFITGLSCCISQKCDAADQLKAVQLAQQLCGSYGVTVPTSAGCTGSTVAATGSSASGASTASSASASAATVSSGSASAVTSTAGVATASTGASTAGAATTGATTAAGTSAAATGSSSTAPTSSAAAAAFYGSGFGAAGVAALAAALL